MRLYTLKRIKNSFPDGFSWNLKQKTHSEPCFLTGWWSICYRLSCIKYSDGGYFQFLHSYRLVEVLANPEFLQSAFLGDDSI
jgi:hypothetical protein